jgi:hypothetical protein
VQQTLPVNIVIFQSNCVTTTDQSSNIFADRNNLHAFFNQLNKNARREHGMDVVFRGVNKK